MRDRRRRKGVQKKLKLEQSWLYAISSLSDLSRRLMVDVGDLEKLASDTGNFNLFEIDGRAIEEPKRRLQRLHARVHELLSRVEAPDYLHSAIKGRSYVTNAQPHKIGALIKIDVHRFFRSVPRHAIYRLFHDRLRCAGDVSGLLANLLTFDRHLATGSSASPILSYYAYKDMFDEIAALAQQRGLSMTCYVDDIAISGKAATPGLLHEVRKIIRRHGLKGHKAKYFRPGQTRIVTGVALVSGVPRLPNKRHLKIKRLFGELEAETSVTRRAMAMTRLLSRLHEAAQVDPEWRVRAYNLQAERRQLLNQAAETTERTAPDAKVD